jgi:hypothetical protein
VCPPCLARPGGSRARGMELGCEHLGSHPGPPRMPLPAVSGSTSPGDSESEGSKTSGSGAEDSDGMTIDSADSDPPDMRGMSLLSWGSYAGCLLVYK